MVPVLEEHPRVALVKCRSQKVDEEGRELLRLLGMPFQDVEVVSATAAYKY